MNYPKGIVNELQQSGLTFSNGYDLLFHGEIPNGAGLSSSASIEVVTAYALLTLEGYARRIRLKSHSSRKNRKMNSLAFNAALWINSQSRTARRIMLFCSCAIRWSMILCRFESGNYKLVIGNTNKRRGLVDSAYNERRSQCEQAVSDLQAAFPDLHTAWSN